ncbi:restriction endonuclease subunit S [Streptomyces sp. NPDC003674]
MSDAFSSLPSTWGRTRLDRIATVNARIGWKALTAAEYQPEGYAFLATPNIKSREIDFGNVNYISEFRYLESPELKLRSGDVLLAKDGNTLGIVNIVQELPREATVNGSIAVLRAFAMEPRFLRYAIASSPVQSRIESVKDGMGVPHLFQRDIKRFSLPEPQIEEQCRIADFLDAETARIDRLNALQRSVLQKLDERESAQLDSGIDELVERHGVVPLRRFLLGVDQGASPQCDAVPAGDDEWGVLKVSCLRPGLFLPAENKRLPAEIEPDMNSEVRAGDLLVVRANTPQLVGSTAVVPVVRRRLLLSDKIFRVRLDSRLSAEFVATVARGRRIRALCAAGSNGASQSMANIRFEEVKAWPIPAAGLAEQSQFVARVAQDRAALGELRPRIERQLALLAERRQALITAAVTGQFDISTASGRNVTEGITA